MPSIISNELNDTKSIKISDIRSNGDSTLRKRRLRSDSAAEDGTKSKSPRRCINGGLNCTENGIIEKESVDNKVVKSRELLVKKLSDDFIDKPKWNPRDAVQLSAVKEALHVSTAPHTVVCREDEKKRVLEFCKQCIEQEKAGSLYVCGCPGTGKSLLMERVKDSLVDWAQGAGFQPPDALAINCTSLTNTSEIFSKILGKNQPQKKTQSSASPLKHLQNLYSQKQQSAGLKMMQAYGGNFSGILQGSDHHDSSAEVNGTSVHCLSTASPGTLCQKSCSCIWRYEESSVHLQKCNCYLYLLHPFQA